MKDGKKGLNEILNSGKDYYEIRLESIGGLGANLCGKMLGEIGVKYLDLNSTNFASYGSEKTGTPVKGFVRYCKKEKNIHVHYPVTKPDLLAVFHKALLNDESVYKGCHENTAVIIALEEGQENVSYNGKGICYGLYAGKIARETHSRINVVMLGAMLKIMGLKDTKAGEKICKDTLGKKYPEALRANLEGLKRGYEEVNSIEVVCGDLNTETDKEKDYEWGYENTPIGGINPRFGSSVTADLSPSRQGYIPVFIKERCINCGLCHTTCPDMVFQFKEGEYKGREMMVNHGLDYYHCKGCLRCVEVCPVNALVMGEEEKYSEKPYFMPNQELIRLPDYYEKSGPDGYITSESFLTEKRMEGGEI